MKKHLQIHPTEYKKYLKDMIDANKDKATKAKERKELEDEVDQTGTAVREAAGAPDSVKKRPLTQPITRYLESGSGPVKYLPDSNYQRRADLDAGEEVDRRAHAQRESARLTTAAERVGDDFLLRRADGDEAVPKRAVRFDE